MILVFLALLFLICMRVGGFFSPGSLLVFVWLSEMGAQRYLGYYLIKTRTEILIGCFIASFVVGTFWAHFIKFRRSRYIWSERKIARAIVAVFIVVLITAPSLFMALRNAVAFDLPTLAQAFRRFLVEANVEGHLPLSLTIIANSSVVLVVLSSVPSEMRLPLRLFMITIGIIGVAISFSKGYFVLMFGFVMATIVFRSGRRYVYAVGSLLAGLLVLLIFAVFRDRSGVADYFRIYLLSSVPAFELIVDNNFHFAFPTLFVFLKPIYEALGMSLTPAGDNFVFVPDYTNVFTAFGPALSDYGAGFTSAYFMLNGFASGIVFRLAQARHMPFTIGYGFIIFAIVTSIFSDGFALWGTFAKYLAVWWAIDIYARRPIQEPSSFQGTTRVSREFADEVSHPI